MASAAATAAARRPDVLFLSARRSNIERSFAIGGRPDTSYALPNRRMRLVWGTPSGGGAPASTEVADIDARSDSERPTGTPDGGIPPQRGSAVHGHGCHGGGRAN